ncbi:DNA-binding response regulator [Paenibacillus sp. 598K]|uniref:response regulator n=1 Tax=Paenibacillus sp. 598K TaxID=1117987 RepID=UPI000FFA2F11|nr:response regulator [Paenibacillus sp. 598K]GBF74944.1 DNA-binding response regulator [Paenibacillus sp. 598K]
MWNLLVVEDEQIVRVGLRYMMKWDVYNVCWKGEASSGEEALRLMETEDFHILLTDIRMPGIDGLRFAKQVRQRYPDVQIIFLSSYGDFDYAKEALRIGAVDYLHKLTMDEIEIGAALTKAVQALQTTMGAKVGPSAEEANDFLLSLLDDYMMPDHPHLAGLELDMLEQGGWLTVLRKREDGSADGDEDHLQFRAMQYLIAERVNKGWGGLVFHRSYREIIWIAPARGATGGDEGLAEFLARLKQKVMELLNVALVYSTSATQPGIKRLPQAYLAALLELPSDDHTDNYIVRKAKQLIDRHLLEDVTLANVAEQAHVSQGYLSRIFLKEMGENFSDYIIRRKLEHAQKLLRETNRKIYEITADIGYSNPQYFSKLFKERIGVTPFEYRNQ